MMALEDFLEKVEGHWLGTGISFETPWSPAGQATTSAHWSILKPSKTAFLNYLHQHETGPRYESLTVIAPGEGPRAWTFDSFGFISESPSTVTLTSTGLLLERGSPKGINRTSFALDGRGTQLVIEVHFVPAASGATPLPVAQTSLTRS